MTNATEDSMISQMTFETLEDLLTSAIVARRAIQSATNENSGSWKAADLAVDAAQLVLFSYVSEQLGDDETLTFDGVAYTKSTARTFVASLTDNA